MSNEIMLESLLSKATDKSVIGNGSIFETLQEANKIAAEADKILSIMEKYKLLDPLRLYFIKKNELDKVKEVGESGGIVPASETHRVAFMELNKFSEKDLQERAKNVKK